MEEALRNMHQTVASVNQYVITTAMLFSLIMPFGVGIYRMIQFGLSIGSFIAIVQLSNNITNPLLQIMQLTNGYATTATIRKRYLEAQERIDKRTVTVNRQSVPSFSSIRLENLAVKFSDTPLFSDVNLTIEKKDKILVILDKAKIDDLKKHIEKLTGLNDKVDLQSQSVYTKEEQEIISSKIVALNKEYTDKVTELERKVAEEKKKKEEAAKKAAAEKKKKEEEAAAAAEAQQYQAQQQGSGDQVSNGYGTQNDTPSNNNGDYSYSAPAQGSNNNYSSGSGSSNAGSSSNAASPSNGGGSYQEPQYQAPAQNNNEAERRYGTVEDENGNRVDNWIEHDGNGNYSLGLGDGSNDQSLGGGFTIN